MDKKEIIEKIKKIANEYFCGEESYSISLVISKLPSNPTERDVAECLFHMDMQNSPIESPIMSREADTFSCI